MRSIFTSAGIVDNIWIGLTDIEEEGVYVWENSGEVASYFDWFSGQPDGAALPEDDCVVMSYNDNYLWYDAPCDTLYRPFCETDPVGI